MPELNNEDVPMKDDTAPAPEVVKKPPTEAERKTAHLAMVANEGEEDRVKRRASEFQALTNVHVDNVKKSHDMYPTRRIDYLKMDQDEQRRWNDKRKNIDQANRAYHLAVRRVANDHREEDIHLAKLREAAAKSAH